MTAEEIRTVYNLLWLKNKGAGANSDFLYVCHEGEPPPDGRQLHHRELVYLDYYSDPARDWPYDKPAPLKASSWADCRSDGLVQWGLWANHHLGPPTIWAIRMTNRGRRLFRSGAHNARPFGNESETPVTDDAKEAGKTTHEQS